MRKRGRGPHRVCKARASGSRCDPTHPLRTCPARPCSNSKQRPNIPAEKLYDKKDDGLRLSNSWAGHYILLNPPYSSQVR